MISWREIRNYRNKKWRLDPNQRIKTEKQAVQFILDVGLVLLFGSEGIPLPKLSQSAKSDEWDWWEWKDTLQVKKKCYNGRVIRKKATLISMELLPCFLNQYYASGGCEVYEEEYYYGKISEPAYRIADYLYIHGPSSIDDLRKVLARSDKAGTRKFHVAINELQIKFKIAVSGLVDKHWGVRVIDLFSRWAPGDILNRADQMKPEKAREEILFQLISTSGITSITESSRLLGWSNGMIESTLELLLRRKKLYASRLKNNHQIYYTVIPNERPDFKGC